MNEAFRMPHERIPEQPSAPLPNVEALEEELELLLADPANKFLTAVPQNAERIENASTAQEALAFAKQKIEERNTKTFHFESVMDLEGITPLEASFAGMKDTVQRVLRGAREIGRGKDGYVVIDRNEMRSLPPEVCYKFTSIDRARRGQNTTSEEAEMQGHFYEVASGAQTDIGVPIPFYSLEIGDKQMIAMEKLNARSLEDILFKKRGDLPDWFEIDAFCEQLKQLIAEFHKHNLFHRDLHYGNIMVSQAERRTSGDKAGYIIDFGVSGYGIEGMDPYKKEVAEKLFTYDDDYGIIEQARKEMHAHRRRKYDDLV